MAQALLLMTLGVTAPAESVPVALCVQPNVTSATELTALWLDAMRSACESLSGNRDLDRDARVHIVQIAPELLRLDVTTSDGRSAQRELHTPQELHDTLEALLVVPRAIDPPEEPPHATETRTSSRPDNSTSITREPPKVHTELGFGAAGRLAQHGRRTFGPSAFAALTVDSWLLGVSLRWDALQNAADNTIAQYEAQAVAIGFTLGRRLYEGAVTIDCAIEPRVVSTAQSHGEGSDEHRTSTADIYVGALARVAFGDGRLRPYIQPDLEVTPEHMKRGTGEDAVYTPLPTWSVGMTLGLRWVLE